jgi:hypothetical protein
MEAVCSPETLVSTYNATQRYNPEDQHGHLHRRENLKCQRFRLSSPVFARCITGVRFQQSSEFALRPRAQTREHRATCVLRPRLVTKLATHVPVARI